MQVRLVQSVTLLDWRATTVLMQQTLPSAFSFFVATTALFVIAGCPSHENSDIAVRPSTSDQGNEKVYATDWRAPDGWGSPDEAPNAEQGWDYFAYALEGGKSPRRYTPGGLYAKSDAGFPTLGDSPFAFRWDIEGRPPSLGMSLVIREDGRTTLIRGTEWEHGDTRDRYTRTEFIATTNEVASIRNALQAVQFSRLASHYSPNDTVYDGLWWDMYVRIDGKLKRVSCSNAWPEEVRWLAVQVVRAVLVPRPELLHGGEIVEAPDWAFKDDIPE